MIYVSVSVFISRRIVGKSLAASSSSPRLITSGEAQLQTQISASEVATRCC